MPMPSKNLRKLLVLGFVDLLLVLGVLFISRYLGHFPRWWVLVLASFIWVGLGFLLGKFPFDRYKKKRYAFAGIIIINTLSGLILSLIESLTRPNFSYDFIPLLSLVLVTIFEMALYIIYRRLVLVKLPFYNEEEILPTVVEPEIYRGAKLPAEKIIPDLTLLKNGIGQLGREDALRWITDHKAEFSPNTIFLSSGCYEEVFCSGVATPDMVVSTLPLNQIQFLDTFLSFINYKLVDNGYLCCHAITTSMKKESIYLSNPPVIRNIVYWISYLWHRVCSKLFLTRRLYKKMTKRQKRSFSRPEVLGRIYRAGFEVVEENFNYGRYYIVAKKVKMPIRDDVPSTGILIRLKRVGKNGEMIGVYKLRTMHSYSEYIQEYTYKISGLEKGGKLNHDFRVSTIGHFLRKTWLDEVPMFINILKGNMKLVGVRPLSQHYFSLYTPQVQQLRIKTKPGLIPPYYAEKKIPVTLEEIQANEQRYLNAYLAHPFATDCKYFFGAMKNILFK